MNSEITQTENSGTETAEAIRVSIVSIIVNIVLSALKLIAGIIAGSGATLGSLSPVFPELSGVHVFVQRRGGYSAHIAASGL